MSWCALDVVSPAAARDAVASWLVEQTGQAVEEHADGTLTGFTQSAAAAGALSDDLRAAFGAGVAVSARTLPDIDWTERWRDGLEARIIGRLTVAPSWAIPADHRGPLVVVDPETAFGTGEHGSTRAALALLDRHLAPGSRVLDLGSGSGILAIAAAKLGAARAAGIDLDPTAEPVAQANAARNGVTDVVTFLTGDAGVFCPLLAPAELILSNILRSANTSLLPVIRGALSPSGVAVFSGMELGERTLFTDSLNRAGLTVLEEHTDEGWWAVAARSG